MPMVELYFTKRRRVKRQILQTQTERCALRRCSPIFNGGKCQRRIIIFERSFFHLGYDDITKRDTIPLKLVNFMMSEKPMT